MRHAEENPRHLSVADWDAEGMDIQIIMFRDTGASPWCAMSLTTNGRGRTMCLSREDFQNTYRENDRNVMGCLLPEIGREFMNPVSCKDTFTDLEITQVSEKEQQGGWIWLNFINPGSHHELRVSIDEHDMYVIAADGEFVHPKKVQALNINLGERIRQVPKPVIPENQTDLTFLSVLVKLDQKPGDYAIRLSSLSIQQVIHGMSILRYHHAGILEQRTKDSIMPLPTSTPHMHPNGTMVSSKAVKMDETLLNPFPGRSPPNYSNHTLRFVANQTGPSTWVLSSSAHQGFRQQIAPILWNPENRGATTFGDGQRDTKNGNKIPDDSDHPHQSVSITNGSVVDIIFESAAEGMHPFHKHNHKAWIIGTGHGFFPWKDVETALKEAPEAFNLVDPPLRDGCRVDEKVGSWTVIRYEVSFPAAR